MDIKYIRENEIHEKYILNQLDEKEKIEYETFLESSSQAREELEQAKKLIAGIRANGTSHMRKEIEEQVADLRHPKTDWSIMYKAAAVLFIFVLLPAIFYYQHKFADQQEISEQITKTYAEPQEVETKDKTATGYGAEEEVFEDEIVEQAEREKEKSTIAKKETTVKVSKLSETKKARAQSIQNVIDIDEEKTSLNKDETLGAGAVENISALDDLAGGTMEQEAAVLKSAGDDLDEVLSRAAGSGVAKSSKSDLPGAARVATPSSSFGLNYVPPVRSYTFVNNNDSLVMNINKVNLRDAFPDFLKIKIETDSLNQIILDLFVSDQLHSVEKEEINMDWKKENFLHINFSDKATYEVKLEKNQIRAIKVR